MTAVGQYLNFLRRFLWDNQFLDSNPATKTLIQMLRVCFALTRDLFDRSIRLRAMGLVYLTLLSIIPSLAFAFSILRSFGIHNRLRDVLLSLVEPLGDQGIEVVDYVLESVSSIQLEGFGVVGLIFLIATSVSTLQTVETALNEVWHVRVGRTLVQRFRTYALMIMFGPIIGFSAIALVAGLPFAGFTSAVENIPVLGSLINESGRLLSFVLAISGFGFLFLFMPNARIRFRPALLAAFLSALAWLLVGFIFSMLVVSSGRYPAIYSAFASLVLFMLWIFSSWLIVLLGSKACYLFQYPDYIVEKPLDLELSLEQKEYLALRTMALIGRHFYEGRVAWTRDALAAYLGVPWLALEKCVDNLVRSNYVQAIAGDPPAFVPSRPLETIAISTFLEDIRRSTSRRTFNVDSAKLTDPIANLCTQSRKPMLASLENSNLKDLAFLIRLEEEVSSTDIEPPTDEL